jgi:RNA polymerase sigma-70 factor (ECF subfamily)
MAAFYTENTDEDLLALMSYGDEAAFTEIYNRYWKRIFLQAASKLDDFALAEDMVQDLLGDLWRRRTELEVSGKLEVYLAVALKYKVINALAVRKRERMRKTESGKKVSVADRSTEYWLDFEDLKGQLEQLVARLPERCRMTYQLGKEQGLSQKEIARHMNISEKAVEQNISRALHSLRLGLKHLFYIFF